MKLITLASAISLFATTVMITSQINAGTADGRTVAVVWINCFAAICFCLAGMRNA